MKIIRDGLAGLTILLASKLPVSAQDAPQEPPKKVEQATEQKDNAAEALQQRYGRIFQFFEPDAAMPGPNHEAQFLYGKGFKDIDGTSMQGRLRTVYGDFRFTGSIYELDFERDESMEEFLPTNPGETNVITTTEDFRRKNSLFSLSGGYGPVELMYTSNVSKEELDSIVDDLFTDPVTTFRTTNANTRESKSASSAFGLRYALGKIQAGAAFWNAKDESISSSVNDVFLLDTFDPMNPIMFTSRDEQHTLDELTRKGMLLSGSLETDILPNHPLMLGLDIGFEQRKRTSEQRASYTENGVVQTSSSVRDTDKATAYRVRAPAEWGWLRFAPGYLSENPEGKAKLTLDADAILWVSDSFAPVVGGGINDLGKAYGHLGLAFTPKENQPQLRSFKNYWVDRQIAPIGDPLLGFFDRAHGLTHYGTTLGVFVTKDANDNTVIMPYFAAGNSNLSVSIAGEITDDVYRGQLMGTVRIFGPIKLITGARANYAKDLVTEFVDRDSATEIDGFVGVGGEIRR